MAAKEDRGMGISDYLDLQVTTCISRMTRLWNASSVWTRWMKRRYIKGRDFDDILPRTSNSPQWKVLMRQREGVAKCITCGSGVGVVCGRGGSRPIASEYHANVATGRNV